MSDTTFTCERCGKEHREADKKEVFVNEGGTEVKKVVCPQCLDEIMNQADGVVGVEGDGLLRFEPEARGFVWDLSRVKGAMVTDNVLALMARSPRCRTGPSGQPPAAGARWRRHPGR